MEKPKYTEELLALIFLWVGAAFLVCGILFFMGILKPTSTSVIQTVSTLSIVFLMTGILFFIIGYILKFQGSRKRRLHKELLKTGVKLDGIAEKVYVQRWMQFGRKSPYRIAYGFSCQNKSYHHKSHLLWDKPDIKENDRIAVYVNTDGCSAINI